VFASSSSLLTLFYPVWRTLFRLAPMSGVSFFAKVYCAVEHPDFVHLPALLAFLLPEKILKTDSAQSSSNKCKNYLLKIYSEHIDFLNTIWNFSLWFISPGDPAMKILSILEKFNVKPRKNASCLCFQLTRNVQFKWNIWNFKFNFLSRGQLESLNLDRIFLPLFKILPRYEGFLVT